MFEHKSTAALLAILVITAGAIPMTAAATGTAADSEAAFEVTVTTTEEWTTITVEQHGEASADAELSVEALGESNAALEGQYQADSNGTVRISTPAADSRVELSVESDTIESSSVITLSAYEGSTETVRYEFGAQVETTAQAIAEATTSDATADDSMAESANQSQEQSAAARSDGEGASSVGSEARVTQESDSQVGVFVELREFLGFIIPYDGEQMATTDANQRGVVSASHEQDISDEDEADDEAAAQEGNESNSADVQVEVSEESSSDSMLKTHNQTDLNSSVSFDSEVTVDVESENEGDANTEADDKSREETAESEDQTEETNLSAEESTQAQSTSDSSTNTSEDGSETSVQDNSETESESDSEVTVEGEIDSESDSDTSLDSGTDDGSEDGATVDGAVETGGSVSAGI